MQTFCVHFRGTQPTFPTTDPLSTIQDCGAAALSVMTTAAIALDNTNATAKHHHLPVMAIPPDDEAVVLTHMGRPVLLTARSSLRPAPGRTPSGIAVNSGAFRSGDRSDHAVQRRVPFAPADKKMPVDWE